MEKQDGKHMNNDKGIRKMLMMTMMVTMMAMHDGHDENKQE